MQFSKNKAIFLQISDYITQQILKKNWPAATKLPSIRELAIDLQVNPNTVARSYASLEQDGIISSKRGIGYFVAENADQQVRAIKKQEFKEHELQALFTTMDLLNISINEIIDLYQQRTINEIKQ